MNWGGWSEFWAMGGYAFYVWTAYGVTFALFALEMVALRSGRRRAIEELRRDLARKGGSNET
jgi:heme exporter protein D